MDWRCWRKLYKNVGLSITQVESSSLGVFINNVVGTPGGWGLGVKATWGNTTRQTKRWPYGVFFFFSFFLLEVYVHVRRRRWWHAVILALMQFPQFSGIFQSRRDLITSRQLQAFKSKACDIWANSTRICTAPEYCPLAEFSLLMLAASGALQYAFILVTFHNLSCLVACWGKKSHLWKFSEGCLQSY